MTAALPVAYYLRELSGEPARRDGVMGRDGLSENEIRISEAHARGVLEGRAAAQTEHDADIASRQAAFEKRLADERQRWAAEQGEHLGRLIATGIEDLARRISDQVGRVLRPLVAEQVRDRAVEQLALSLGTMIAKGDYGKITISGPRDLLAAVEARLAARPANVAFVEAETVDLKVSADDTVLETRINEWAAAIQRNAGGETARESGALKDATAGDAQAGDEIAGDVIEKERP